MPAAAARSRASSPNTVQMIAAENLASDVLSFLRLDRAFASSTFAGGRARLAQQLLELTEATPGQSLEPTTNTVALPVDPVRVALPEEAGTIDPSWQC